MNNCIVVCGPTASGKTRLAVELASRLDGEILSVDSRQVYRGMDIGTGKDLHEYNINGIEIPYHLIDIAEPADIFTLYDYQKAFYDAYRAVRGRRRIPVAAGGSGLYLEAVLKHYRISPVPENVALRKELMKETRETLESMLLNESREMFERTDRSTKKRIVRALEIVRSGIENKELSPGDYPDIRPIILYVVWERGALRERISRRLEERLLGGMIDEVQRLLTAGISMERFSLFGMEYKHVARYLHGQVCYDQMVSDLQQDIFHLAKRQDTWFRGMERRGLTIYKVERGVVDQAWAVIEKYGDF
ncbi:MAG: tRNA (adenosine(37)-N6)-dimethylallyltransferase MiaA [Chitinispirillaceae bacterium]